MTTMASPQSFARAFGDALRKFLEVQGKSQAGAARDLGIDRARLNTYLKDSRKGTRATPSAEVLYLACVGLGFEFEYEGYRVTGSMLNGKPPKLRRQPQQLSLDFERQFNLTNQQGTVSVTVKRPPGRIEVSLSLRAAGQR